MSVTTGKISVSSGTTPVRTCIGCRQRAATADLIRLVAVDGHHAGGVCSPCRVEIDRRRTMPGRGAWLHPRSRCLDAAVRRKAFRSALRIADVIVDGHALGQGIAEVFAADGCCDDREEGQTDY